jgi:flagellar biosynthetic protein FliQ
MTPETVVDVMRNAMELAAIMAGPILLAGLVAGVLVSIFQATTQINDQTLVIVPKILATLLALMFLGSWMLQMYIDYTRKLLLSLPTMVG